MESELILDVHSATTGLDRAALNINELWRIVRVVSIIKIDS